MSLAICNIDEVARIASVTVNRPDKLNALDLDTAIALQGVMAKLEARQDLRCILIRGSGRAFLAGGDLEAMASDFDRAGDVVNGLLDEMDPVVMTIQHHAAPVLASVHGAVAGAGLSLMAACDIVIAAESTQFLLGYDKVGATPDCGGTYFLPRLLGERRAASLMYLGETWNAAQALRFGLINRVVADEELRDATDALAASIAEGPSLAFAKYKALVRQSRDNSLSEQLAEERAAFVAATGTDDFRAGVTAFLRREPGRFNGQ